MQQVDATGDEGGRFTASPSFSIVSIFVVEWHPPILDRKREMGETDKNSKSTKTCTARSERRHISIQNYDYASTTTTTALDGNGST